MLQRGADVVVNGRECLRAFLWFCRSGCAEELYGVLAKAAVCFYGEGNEVWMWVASSFVLFAAFRGVVGVWRGVSRGSSFGNWVGDTHVDVISGCLVVSDNIELGPFVLWSAHVSVELGDVYFKLCVMSMLLQPFLEDADESVVFVYSMASTAASSCVLGVLVKWV